MRIVPVLLPLIVIVVLAAACTQPITQPAPQVQMQGTGATPSPAPVQTAFPDITNRTPVNATAHATAVEATALQFTPSDTMTIRPVPIPSVISQSSSPQGQRSNCEMVNLLPGLLGDPEYGLNGPANARLTGFSDGQYQKILRDAAEKQGAIDYCYQVIPTPYWTWVVYNAVIIQRGAQPMTYTITLYANYENTRIPVVSSVENLSPGQEYPYKVRIPIKSDQVSDIISFELGFVPLTD